MSGPKGGREFLPMNTVAAIRKELLERVPAATRRESAKVLAFRVNGVTPNAVKRWKSGDNEPSAAAFLRLAMELPELREWVAVLLNLGPIDPRAKKIRRYIDAVLADRGPD